MNPIDRVVIMAVESDTDAIENRFNFHPANTQEKQDAHEAVRNSLRTVAHYLDGFLPVGREKALALTKLEEAMFWANAAVARNS